MDSKTANSEALWALRHTLIRLRLITKWSRTLTPIDAIGKYEVANYVEGTDIWE